MMMSLTQIQGRRVHLADVILRIWIVTPLAVIVTFLIPLGVSDGCAGCSAVELANMVFVEQKKVVAFFLATGCLPLLVIRQYSYGAWLGQLEDLQPGHARYFLTVADVLVWLILMPLLVFATVPLFSGASPNVVPYSVTGNIVGLLVVPIIVWRIRKRTYGGMDWTPTESGE